MSANPFSWRGQSSMFNGVRGFNRSLPPPPVRIEQASAVRSTSRAPTANINTEPVGQADKLHRLQRTPI